MPSANVVPHIRIPRLAPKQRTDRTRGYCILNLVNYTPQKSRFYVAVFVR